MYRILIASVAGLCLACQPRTTMVNPPDGEVTGSGSTTRADSARVVFEYLSERVLPAAALSITFDDGTGARTVAGRDLTTADYAVPHSRTFETPASGKLNVHVLLVSGDTLGRGHVEVPLRNDWVYGIQVAIDSVNPMRSCFGCIGSRSFPLNTRKHGIRADSFYVIWGGNSISKPVVY